MSPQDDTIKTIPEEYNDVVERALLLEEFNGKHMSFEFLKSSRFWSIVVGAVVIYLKSKGIIGVDEMLLIDTILAGHVVIRTVDRNTGDAVKKV